MRESFKTGRPVVNQPVYIISAGGERKSISISTAILKDGEGNIIGGVETFRDLSAIEELRRELEKKYSFEDIISKNREMLNVFDILPNIAESDSTVLIEGESGTGKELIARAIHNLSHRKKGPMVAVNCGALPDTLLESELFGYKAGAFTGARKDKPGRFALAEGGTIFLDEIADVSPALQVRLLRVLQDHTYDPLGGTRSLQADVRVIAASNTNLAERVKAGRFRGDLYYRINVVSVGLPPLRQRKGDIPLLINHFLRRLGRLKKKDISDISPEAEALLMTYDYPGNIRELENIIEHAFVLCRKNIITVEDLPDTVRPQRDKMSLPMESFDDLEKAYIANALRQNQWNRKATAESLGMHKTTLWRKMKKLGIQNSDGE